MQRLGVIIPSSNTTVECEFSSALQGTNISAHYARIHLNDVTVEGLACMEGELDGAASLLKDARVDCAVFACTSGSLIKGVGYDVQLANRIAKAAGCPALTTSGVVIDALTALKARKVCLATPYLQEVTDHEVGFLEKNGFDVIKQQSLNIKENLQIGLLPPSKVEVLVKGVYCCDADAVFISCTNLRTFEVVCGLEAELGLPVVSSNSATLWAALGALGVRVDSGLGRLFDSVP